MKRLVYEVPTDLAYYGDSATDTMPYEFRLFVERWMLEQGFQNVEVYFVYDHPIRSSEFSDDEVWSDFCDQY